MKSNIQPFLLEPIDLFGNIKNIKQDIDVINKKSKKNKNLLNKYIEQDIIDDKKIIQNKKYDDIDFFGYKIQASDFLENIYNIYNMESFKNWIDNNLINLKNQKKYLNKNTIKRIINYFYYEHYNEINKNKILFSNIIKDVIRKMYNIDIEENNIIIELNNYENNVDINNYNIDLIDIILS